MRFLVIYLYQDKEQEANEMKYLDYIKSLNIKKNDKIEFYCLSAKKFVEGTVLTPVKEENMTAISKSGKVIHLTVYVIEVLLENGNIELIPFKSYYFDRYVKHLGIYDYQDCKDIAEILDELND